MRSLRCSVLRPTYWLALLLLTAAAAIGIAVRWPPSTMSTGVVRVGVDHAPPFYLIHPDGSVHGLAVEVLNEAARREGIRLQWAPQTGTTLDDALRRRTVDLWPLVGTTPERRAALHLTDPWLDSDYVLVSPQTHPIRGAEDARGQRISHARLTLVTQIAKKYLPESGYVVTRSRIEAIEAMCNGQVAAALLESRVLDPLLMDRPAACQTTSLSIARLAGAAAPLSIAATPEAAATADRLRHQIGELAEDGFLDDRLAEWVPISAGGTRSLFAIVSAERRSQRYQRGLALLFAVVLLLLLQARRAHRLRRRAEQAEVELRESELRFQTFMDHSPAITFIKNQQGHMLYINRQFAHAFGAAPANCCGKGDFELWPPGVAHRLRENDRLVFAGGKATELLEDVPLPSGEVRQFLVVKFPFSDTQGRTLLGGIAVDMTERVRANQERERLLAQRTALLESAGNAIYGLDTEGRCTFLNARAAELLGYTSDECLGKRMHELIQAKRLDGSAYSSADCPIQNVIERGLEARCEDEVFWRKDGTPFPVGYHARPLIVEGQIEGAIVTFADITVRKEAEARLRAEASTDSLTGLANRRRFEQQLAISVAAARLQQTPLSLALCDIDNFKEINDQHGHAAGDEVLSIIGQLLRQGVRSSDLASRLGGDEFAILFTQTKANEAARCLERIRQRLETVCFGLGLERPFTVTATFGVAELCTRHQTGQDLLETADRALYQAKRNGRNQTYAAGDALILLPSRSNTSATDFPGCSTR